MIRFLCLIVVFLNLGIIICVSLKWLAMNWFWIIFSFYVWFDIWWLLLIFMNEAKIICWSGWRTSQTFKLILMLNWTQKRLFISTYLISTLLICYFFIISLQFHWFILIYNTIFYLIMSIVNITLLHLGCYKRFWRLFNLLIILLH